MFPFAPTLGTFSGTGPSLGRLTLLWEKIIALGCESFISGPAECRSGDGGSAGHKGAMRETFEYAPMFTFISYRLLSGKGQDILLAAASIEIALVEPGNSVPR